MNTAFLSKTNLLESIDVQLGLQPSITIEKLSQEIKKDIEKSFEEFYENDMKTGFYIQNSDENEDVQFYNYNTEGGWWQLQQGDSDQPHNADEEQKQSDTANLEDKFLFFNKTGTIIEEGNEEQKKKYFFLNQQSRRFELLQSFYDSYDYILVLIYSGKHQTGNSDQVLSDISNHLKTFKNVSVTNLVEHRSWRNLEQPTGFYRISLFVSKFGHLDDEARSQQFNVVEKLKELENQNKGLIIIPAIVKEEIKDIIKNDFSEDPDEKDIFEYAQQHRYECLFDSESEDERGQSSGESCHEDEEEDDDDDDNEGKDKNNQVFVEK